MPADPDEDFAADQHSKSPISVGRHRFPNGQSLIDEQHGTEFPHVFPL